MITDVTYLQCRKTTEAHRSLDCERRSWWLWSERLDLPPRFRRLETPR